jgi:hypothetical protein
MLGGLAARLDCDPMDGKQDLNSALDTQSAPSSHSCPTCGGSWDRVLSVTSLVFDGGSLFCCVRCGGRFRLSGEEARIVPTCCRCGLPYAADDPDQQHCSDCDGGSSLGRVTDPAVVLATETEIQFALANHWDLITMPNLQVYLDRLIGAVAQRIGDAPQHTRVVLFDDDALRTLALSSGTVFISRGLLEVIKDEAELVFVLGHELAHAASPSTPSGMVRIGLRTVSQQLAGASRAGWVLAAEEAIRLGHGLEGESQADLKALEVMQWLGYDARSAVRFLSRLERLIEQETPEVSEYKVAHPAPLERRRQVERKLALTVDRETVLKINREPFRRAAGPDVLAGGFHPLTDFDPSGETAARAAARLVRDRRFTWAALGLVLLVILFLVAGKLLSN